MHEIKNPTAAAFFKKETDFIARLPSDDRERLPSLEFGSRELDAWVWYFDSHLRWRPAALQQFLLGRVKGMTVATQWPEWFDLSYVPPSNIPRVPRPDAATKRARHESMTDLRARLGPTYGLGGPPDPEGYVGLTSRYGRPMGRFEQGTKWEAYVGRTTAERLPTGMAQISRVAEREHVADEIPITESLARTVRRQSFEHAAE